MNKFQRLFQGAKPIIGMVHLKPLPGSPGYGGDMEEICRAALADLAALEKGGAHGAIVENFGDVPYGAKTEPVTQAAMVHIATRLRAVSTLPLGINVQFNDYEAEWAIAYACGLDFIRVEVFAEHRMGPNGYLAPCGPELMRLKARYPRDILLLADVHVKHTFPVVEQPLDFTVESILEGGADALICTGLVTGKSPSVADVEEMKGLSGGAPVIVGSGVSEKTVRDYLAVSDGAIIGSSLKVDGVVTNPVDAARVARLTERLG